MKRCLKHSEVRPELSQTPELGSPLACHKAISALQTLNGGFGEGVLIFQAIYIIHFKFNSC